MRRPWQILFVGTDPDIERLGTVAARLPAEVRLARAGTGAARVLLDGARPPDAIVLALARPDAIGGELVTQLKTHHPPALSQVVVLAHEPSVAQTVDVMRAGAFALLEQPVADDALVATLRQACEECAHERKADTSTSSTSSTSWTSSTSSSSLPAPSPSPSASLSATPSQFPRLTRPAAAAAATARILGRSRGIRELLDTLRRVAPSDANCLLVGENGTGKELVAEAIHASSQRADGPFVKVNCAAIPATLLESELFGHTRGAFTDAIADRQGLFERANGGSLFLDEIGEMPTFLQVKLLRVLQEREFRPIGANRTVTLDIRLICATNTDVDKAVKARELREDLLFRINTITLRVPALRERLDDLSLLATHFLEEFSRRYERETPRLSMQSMEVMTRYPWPGNVRELENLMERAVILTRGDTIDPEALPLEIRHPKPTVAAGPPLMKLDEIERRALLAALERANWNKQVAAAALGIYRPTLYSKMRKYAIQDPRRG